MNINETERKAGNFPPIPTRDEVRKWELDSWQKDLLSIRRSDGTLSYSLIFLDERPSFFSGEESTFERKYLEAREIYQNLHRKSPEEHTSSKLRGLKRRFSRDLNLLDGNPNYFDFRDPYELCGELTPRVIPAIYNQILLMIGSVQYYRRLEMKIQNENERKKRGGDDISKETRKVEWTDGFLQKN